MDQFKRHVRAGSMGFGDWLDVGSGSCETYFTLGPKDCVCKNQLLWIR